MSKTKKLLIAAVCLVAILTTAVVGTIAWLFHETAPIQNTFSPSNIGLTLVEEDFNGKMVPGTTIEKEAIVTVTNDIDCYVFVKVTESTNLETFITYELEGNWNEVPGQDNVYYRLVAADAGVKAFSVLDNDEVTVNSNVTKSDMATLSDNTKYPTLTFVAYAIQSAGFETVGDAWTAASALATN